MLGVTTLAGVLMFGVVLRERTPVAAAPRG